MKPPTSSAEPQAAAPVGELIVEMLRWPADPEDRYDTLSSDYVADLLKRAAVALATAPVTGDRESAGVEAGDQRRQLIDQARERLSRLWLKQGWRAEKHFSSPDMWSVWTLDATGQHRIVMARGLSTEVAALMTFVSTALPQLCDLAEAALATPPSGGGDHAAEPQASDKLRQRGEGWLAGYEEGFRVVLAQRPPGESKPEGEG